MWALNTIEKSTYLSFVGQLKIALDKANNKKIAIWGASVRGIIAGMILEDLGEKNLYTLIMIRLSRDIACRDML